MPGVPRRGNRLGWLLLLVLPMALWTTAAAVAAGCLAAMAAPSPNFAPLSLVAATSGEAELAFLGHASFLIESPGGVSIVTDYNGINRPSRPPDIVTMNHAHSTHYTDLVDPEIKFVLRGWDTGNGIPHHDLRYGDVRVRNVPTNIRDGGGGTEFGGNSIFIIEVANLCIAHLGHLHHSLTPEHLATLGQVDVLLAPIDGAFTMSQDDMLAVVEQIRPPLLIPMHYFASSVLARFLARAGDRYPVRTAATPSVALSRAALPKETEILVLPGY